MRSLGLCGPKARSDAEPLITRGDRRRELGSSFAEQQSVEEAREYDALRPRYPEQSVRDILALSPQARENLAEPLRIADLGAGTGILARQLLAHGARVDAVEPSTAMTHVLAETAGEHAQRLTIVPAPAEQTGLPPGNTDIVVAAQAWHWFDADAVQQEITRLLVPGGALALIWNYLDTSEQTVHRLTRIMRAGDVYRPGWKPALEEPRFDPVRTVEYRWSRSLTVGEIFRYATTLSSWLSAGEKDRARRRANLEDYLLRERGLTEEDAVELPMITVLHSAQLRCSAQPRRPAHLQAGSRGRAGNSVQ